MRFKYSDIACLHSGTVASPGQLKTCGKGYAWFYNFVCVRSFLCYFYLKVTWIILQYSKIDTTFGCLNPPLHLITGQTAKGKKHFISTANMTGSWPAENNKRFDDKDLRLQSGLLMNPLSEITFWSHCIYSVIWIKTGKCLCL